MISPTTYSSRHAVSITWQKEQEIVQAPYLVDVKVGSSEYSTTVQMISVAAPETLQSEGYASTVALFLLFSTSPKEEKVALRLPPAFRDLWQELCQARQKYTDTNDRQVVKTLRDLIREQQEKDEDDDVILTAGLKSRSKAASGVNTPSDPVANLPNPRNDERQGIKDLWSRKASTPAYKQMLSDRTSLPMFQFKEIALSAVRQNQVTILCGETGCGMSSDSLTRIHRQTNVLQARVLRCLHSSSRTKCLGAKSARSTVLNPGVSLRYR